MSNRSLIELNHDYCPRHEDAGDWADSIRLYMMSGDPQFLPQGVTLKATRHHSEPDFEIPRKNGGAQSSLKKTGTSRITLTLLTSLRRNGFLDHMFANRWYLTEAGRDIVYGRTYPDIAG